MLAEELDSPMLTSQALAMWVTVSCMCGQGVDERSLQRALELEDLHVDVPVPLRASTTQALILAWTGRLDEARAQMRDIRRRCSERGSESLMMFVSLHSALIEIWSGSFAEAAQIADDAMERTEKLGGGHMHAIAQTIRATVGAYTGRKSEARADAQAALEAAQQCAAPSLAERPNAVLGFLEVSLGNYSEALTALAPLISGFDAIPGTEIVTASFLPDAIEAMVALGQLDDGCGGSHPARGGARLRHDGRLAVGRACPRRTRSDAR